MRESASKQWTRQGRDGERVSVSKTSGPIPRWSPRPAGAGAGATTYRHNIVCIETGLQTTVTMFSVHAATKHSTSSGTCNSGQ